MTEPVAVRVFCGDGCGREVGRVVMAASGPRYRWRYSAGPDFILGGWSGVLRHQRRLKALGMGKPPGPEVVIDLDVTVTDEDDHGDEFPTYCDVHGQGRVDRRELVGLVYQFDRTRGVRQHTTATR